MKLKKNNVFARLLALLVLAVVIGSFVTIVKTKPFVSKAIDIAQDRFTIGEQNRQGHFYTEEAGFRKNATYNKNVLIRKQLANSSDREIRTFSQMNKFLLVVLIVGCILLIVLCLFLIYICFEILSCMILKNMRNKKRKSCRRGYQSC